MVHFRVAHESKAFRPCRIWNRGAGVRRRRRTEDLTGSLTGAGADSRVGGNRSREFDTTFSLSSLRCCYLMKEPCERLSSFRSSPGVIRQAIDSPR